MTQHSANQLFGIDRTEIEELVAAVSAPDRRDSVDPAEVFARSTWTYMAEPGDGVAGAVVARLGAARALQLLIDRSSPEQLHELVPEFPVSDLKLAIERWLPRLGAGTAKLAMSQAARFGVRLIDPTSEQWPQGMSDLGSHAPIALWVRGRISALTALERSISLVGARAATGYGEHVTMEASAGLVDRGFAIVSGAAYGIDGMAHRAALASKGTTIAFLAGGVDRFYPSGHDALLNRIVETGAVVSEVPCGVPPTKWRFLQRNRLIAAASQATIVLEAGWRSGSLNTAGHAAAMGRPVGAVPGPVTSATSAGCHRLIRGFDATLVTNADEMAELAGTPLLVEADSLVEPALLVEPVETTTHSPHSESARLLDSMSDRSPRTTLDLARRSGLSVTTVQALLGTLELEGSVKEREKGWVRAR